MRAMYLAWQAETGSRRQRIALGVIVAVGLIVRVAWARATMHLPPFLSDPTNYYISGAEIARGHGYRGTPVFFQNLSNAFSGRPLQYVPYTAFYPPGYPFFLGAVFWLAMHSAMSGDVYRVGVYLNVALGVATLVLTFEVMRRLFEVRVALVAAGIQAVYPNLIFHTGQLGYDSLFNFLSMALVLVIVASPWPEGRVGGRRLVAVALLMGVAIFVRPTVAFFVPALAVAWRCAGASWGRVLRQCGVVALIVVAMLVPWTVRNVVRMHSPVIISTGIGPALCASRLPGAHGGYDMATSKRYCNPNLSGLPDDEQEVAINDDSTRKAISFVIHHPVSELNQWFWRTTASYGTDHDALEGAEVKVSAEWMTVWRNVADGFYFAVLALGLLGARAFATRASPPRLFYVLAAVSLAVVPVILWGDPRYKVPLLPLLTGMAAVGIVGVWDGAEKMRA